MSRVPISYRHFSEIVSLSHDLDRLINESPVGSFVLPNGEPAYRLFKDLGVAYILKEPFRSWMIDRGVVYTIEIKDQNGISDSCFTRRWASTDETWNLSFSDPNDAMLFKLTWSDQLF